MAYWLRGRFHEQRDQENDARTAYREVVQRDPEHDEARLRLAALLVRVSQAEEAIEHLDYLQRRLPANDELPSARARALEILGRTDEARAALDEALKRKPDNAQALADRGRMARIDGDLELAERLLAQAVARDPGNVTTRYQLYLTLNGLARYAEAKAEQERIRKIEDDMQRIRAIVNGRLQQTPDDPALHYDVAMIALRSGLPREVHRWLQSALQADPNHLPTHRALATYYREMGEPILSARHRSIAQRLAGKSP
jgi:tetratricopeptide (TPR) repeat protein